MKNKKINYIPYLFLIPTFILLVLFSYYPMVNAIYHSFFEWDGYSTPTFIGLKNFAELFGDTAFKLGIRNTFIFILSTIIITVTLPYLGAELVFNVKHKKLQYLYKVLFVVPMIIPGMVTLLLWQFIYEPTTGMLNTLLKNVGLDFLTKSWLGDPSTAIGAIIFIGFPWISGLAFLLYLAALQQIPEEIYEAAELDGVTAIQKIFYINIPNIFETMKLLVTLAVIGAVQVFTNVWVMTQGGPADATTVPGIVLYNNGFYYSRFGYACAIGTIIFVITMILTIINFKFVGRKK